MKNHKWKGLLVSGLAIGLVGGALRAQPGMGAGAPPPPPDGAPPFDGGPNAARPDMRNMTPEQRREAMQKMRAEGLRRTMNEAGFTQTATQDAVIAFMAAQDEAAQPLRDQMRKLGEAMRDTTVTDAQMAPLLADFRMAVEAERARRAKALKDLDAKIGYSKKPRLDAMLTLAGIIGDEASLVGGGGRGMGDGRGMGGGRGGWPGGGGAGGDGRGGRGGGAGGAGQMDGGNGGG